MTRRWAPQICFKLRRNAASIIKDLIFDLDAEVCFKVWCRKKANGKGLFGRGALHKRSNKEQLWKAV